MYSLSSRKRALVRNALKKGLKADIVERILDSVGLIPQDEETSAVRIKLLEKL